MWAVIRWHMLSLTVIQQRSVEKHWLLRQNHLFSIFQHRRWKIRILWPCGPCMYLLCLFAKLSSRLYIILMNMGLKSLAIGHNCNVVLGMHRCSYRGTGYCSTHTHTRTLRRWFLFIFTYQQNDRVVFMIIFIWNALVRRFFFVRLHWLKRIDGGQQSFLFIVWLF